MLTADRTLVRAQESALEQRGDAMHSGHEHVGGVRRGGLVDDHMIVAEPRQTRVPAPRIREDAGARLDGFLHERPQRLAADVGHPAQPHATEPLLVNDFHGHRYHRPFLRVAPLGTDLRPSHVRLVDLDDAQELVPIRSNHGPPQLVQPRPRRLITVDAEHAFDVDRIRPVLVSHDFPRRDEPEFERLSRSLKDGPGRHRSAAPTIRAEGAARRTPGVPGVAAGWAHESARPTQALQETAAGRFVREEPVEVRQVRRIVDARPQA